MVLSVDGDGHGWVKMWEHTGVGGQDDEDILGFPGDGFKDTNPTGPWSQ